MNQEKKEDSMIELHFDGQFVKEGNSITARTLGHALLNLQRMVDKSLLFEKKGSIKKRDVLPSVWYPDADLVVKPFKKGCVTVPLKGLSNTNVVSTLKGLLHDPYQKAISDDDLEPRSLIQGLENAFNRAVYRIDMMTHDQILKDAPARQQRYFAEGVLRDFDNLISPLRSSAITEEDLISIEFKDSNGVKEFEFTKITSKRFHKIVSERQLGPVVLYEGRLVEFGETKSNYFPYSGRLFSEASKQEHKLLISKESDADLLRQYNTSKKLTLKFIGAPVMAWGTFDEAKGDLVFLKLID